MRSSPVNQALIMPKQIGGVDVKLFFINCCVTVFFVVSVKIWQWIFMAFIFHHLLKIISRQDPSMLNIYITYSKQVSRYEPWGDPKTFKNARPEGFGRGVL